MVDNLISTLEKTDCTVSELTNVLKSQTNIRIEINKEISGMTPLYVAIKERKNLEILNLLIKNNAEVNKKILFDYIDNACTIDACEDCATEFYNVIKLLLEHADNIRCDDLCSVVEIFFQNKLYLETKIFISILRKMLKQADKFTKTYALYYLLLIAIESTGYRCKYKKRIKNNALQATKLLLDWGAHPTFDIFTFLFKGFKNQKLVLTHFPTRHNLIFAISLFKVILPYVFIKNDPEDIMIYDMSIMNNGTSAIINNGTSRNDRKVAQKLMDSLKTLWETHLLEYHKMRLVILNNKSDLLETLDELCSTDVESNNVSSTAIYDIMGKITEKEYPHFSDVIIHAVKKFDAIELYYLISKPHAGNNYFIHPDCFPFVSQYLSQDDVFNYLFALILRNS